MKNLGLKKLVVGLLIAVSAIACFAGAGLVAYNLKKYEAEKNIHIAGLEYEDGWNLISTAEDYYKMTKNTSTGANAGAKYRLTNDILIDPSKANNNAFIGATFDVNGFNIEADTNVKNINQYPEYIPDSNVNADWSIIDIYDEDNNSYPTSPDDFLSDYPTGYTKWSCINLKGYDGKDRYIYGVGLGGTELVSSSDAGGKVAEVNSKTLKIAGENYKATSMQQPYAYQFVFAFGYFGVVKDANITNLYVRYNATIKIDLTDYDPGSTNAVYCGLTGAFGGIAGVSINSNINNCLVEYGPNSDIKIYGCAVTRGLDGRPLSRLWNNNNKIDMTYSPTDIINTITYTIGVFGLNVNSRFQTEDASYTNNISIQRCLSIQM